MKKICDILKQEGKQMEFLDVIDARRSTRIFSKEEIKKEKVVKLIESARLAPTAANRQNWFFLILEEDKKEKVANMMQEYLDKEGETLNDRVKSQRYSATSSVKGSIRVIKEAPILILALRRNDKNWIEGDYLSMGAAIENICLTATSLHLASLWIRDIIYVRDRIEKEFSMEKMDLVSAIAIGVSREFPYERKKKSLEEIMKWG